MVTEHEVGTVVNTRLRQAVGYRVDLPEGHFGIVQGVPPAGRPTRPLHLAVLEHEPETGLGTLAGSLDAAGVEYDVLKTHQPFPPPGISTASSRSVAVSASTTSRSMRDLG